MIGYLKGALLVASALVVLWAYNYVGDMRQQLDVKTAQLAQNEIIIDGLTSSLNTLKVDIEAASDRIEKVEEARKVSKKALDNLEETINKHNLAKIRNRKPELLRRVYERGTNKYYREIQDVMEK